MRENYSNVQTEAPATDPVQAYTHKVESVGGNMTSKRNYATNEDLNLESFMTEKENDSGLALNCALASLEKELKKKNHLKNEKIEDNKHAEDITNETPIFKGGEESQNLASRVVSSEFNRPTSANEANALSASIGSRQSNNRN